MARAEAVWCGMVDQKRGHTQKVHREGMTPAIVLNVAPVVSWKFNMCIHKKRKSELQTSFL